MLRQILIRRLSASSVPNLPSLTPDHINELKASGFTILAKARSEAAAVGIEQFAKYGAAKVGWRYPPLDDRERRPEMDDVYGTAFNSMYHTASSALLQVLQHSNLDCPQAVRGDPMPAGATAPFVGLAASLPFSASFCSLFNFDRGFLNAHKDRGLLTVVCGSAEGAGRRVTLWVRAHGGEWVDLGLRAGAEDVVLFVGEQLEERSGGVYRAVDHACRVDPEGERLNTTLEREPDACEEGNRKSIALVLCELDE
ncbi:hypothetical protein TeGR_g14833 [Tetraparma gracilis]|uniref:Isopenicillin N synthase-like Fe(2+) 2OG dioxygenase domain-containing protein n=1 Tax=Tetraparma gracilis TaxID=2962635 RepID=A0ABQ6M3F3_9STRA|nr:hypothetical protein TeGR_g14833 [Tetraparma gracilis]